MKLPSLTEIRLTNWPGSVFEQWQEATRAVQQEGSGLYSDRFKACASHIKNWVYHGGKPEEFRRFLEDRLYIRALSHLWLEDETVRKRTLKASLLNYIYQKSNWLGRLTAVQLMSVYLKFYETLNNINQHTSDTLQALKRLIHQQLSIFLSRSESKPNLGSKTIFDAFTKYGNLLLADNAVLKTVNFAIKQGLVLEDLFVRLGLKGFDNGVFAERCRYIFYIKKIEELDEGQWDSVLQEVQREPVYSAHYDGSKLLGHVVLELLIDKVTDRPTDEWLKVMLEIAGDPRISKSAPNYRKWWVLVGDERISRVRQWLAKEDLRLFLEAVEAYGVSSGNESLQRMFPARKKFLEGLFEQGRVRNARLMLGNRAASHINSRLNTETKINYIRLSGLADTAVIYLDCKDFYLIQGSHNFKIWLYLAKPTKLFDSYDIGLRVGHSDLIHSIPREYSERYPGLPYKDITHHENTWRNAVVSFLYENGVSIDLEKIMAPQDYNYYIRRFGQPYLQRRRYSAEQYKRSLL